MSNPTLLANLSGVAAIICWTISAWVVVNTGNMPPMLLSSIAALIGFISCLIYWIVRGEPIASKFHMSRRAYALGIIGICGYMILWLVGLKTAPAFEANALNYTWPLLLVLISSRLDRTRLSLPQIIGLCTGLAGSTIIFAHNSTSAIQNENGVWGLIFAFAGACVWAIYSSLTRYVSFPSDRVGVFLLIASALSFLLHLFFDGALPFSMDHVNWWAIALLGATRVSFVFWDVAMKKGNRQMLGSSAYLVPAASVLLLGATSKTDLSEGSLSGVALIILGCLIANAPKINPLLQKV